MNHRRFMHLEALNSSHASCLGSQVSSGHCVASDRCSDTSAMVPTLIAVRVGEPLGGSAPSPPARDFAPGPTSLGWLRPTHRSRCSLDDVSCGRRSLSWSSRNGRWPVVRSVRRASMRGQCCLASAARAGPHGGTRPPIPPDSHARSAQAGPGWYYVH